jgi:elongation factor Ts
MGASAIKQLRGQTGAGILDCKKALDASDGNINDAIDWLRAKGIAKAAKKAGRAATEGVVKAYIHAGGKIGVLVEINAETDFVTMTDEFKELTHNIALHIAAAGPEYVAREDVPQSAVDHERQVQIQRAIEEGKPQNIAEKIVEGRMGKYFQDVCLLEQVFVKDDKLTVGEMLTNTVAKIGENIVVRRFTRYTMGEGLEKKVEDFAAEVAATMTGN